MPSSLGIGYETWDNLRYMEYIDLGFGWSPTGSEDFVLSGFRKLGVKQQISASSSHRSNMLIWACYQLCILRLVTTSMTEHFAKHRFKASGVREYTTLLHTWYNVSWLCLYVVLVCTPSNNASNLEGDISCKCMTKYLGLAFLSVLWHLCRYGQASTPPVVCHRMGNLASLTDNLHICL